MFAVTTYVAVKSTGTAIRANSSNKRGCRIIKEFPNLLLKLLGKNLVIAIYVLENVYPNSPSISS
jgi:hypothetical protein